MLKISTFNLVFSAASFWSTFRFFKGVPFSANHEKLGYLEKVLGDSGEEKIVIAAAMAAQS